MATEDLTQRRYGAKQMKAGRGEVAGALVNIEQR